MFAQEQSNAQAHSERRCFMRNEYRGSGARFKAAGDPAAFKSQN
jgi:hypothetical protein